MAISILIVYLLLAQYHVTSQADLNSTRLYSFNAENVTDGEVDEIGKIYLSAGSHLYRLNGNLVLEEMKNLTSESVNISLSVDGKWLVVCMIDLSCEVYSAANLTSGPVTVKRADAIRSKRNIALFSIDNSFYVGSISTGATGAQQQITLGRFEFDSNRNEHSNYDITARNFERNFYDGFVKGNNSYYFAIDNNPTRVRDIRVMRVCHSSDFQALYELTLLCGGGTPSSDTRISGLSVLNKFAGVAGPTVILSRNRPLSSQNYVCLYSLQTIDDIMQEKYDSCTAAVTGSREQIELAWRRQVTFCDGFQVRIHYLL